MTATLRVSLAVWETIGTPNSMPSNTRGGNIDLCAGVTVEIIRSDPQHDSTLCELRDGRRVWIENRFL